MSIIEFHDSRDINLSPSLLKVFTNHNPVKDGDGLRVHPEDVELMNSIAELLSAKHGYKIQWVWWR